jgi:hypothetical protein
MSALRLSSSASNRPRSDSWMAARRASASFKARLAFSMSNSRRSHA